MAEKMSLVQKIAKIRTEFAKREVKKSGHNEYANFKYFELSDILPICNELCNEVGIVPVYSFNDECAILDVYDSDSEQIISFKIFTMGDDIGARMGQDKQSRGMQPVQRLGSVVTYCKRYLYLNFLDIVENDVIDASDSKKREKEQEKELADLSIKYTDLRVEMKKLDIDFRGEFENWILEKAKVKTQDMTELTAEEMKRLNTVYRTLIKGKKDKEIEENNKKAVAEAGGF